MNKKQVCEHCDWSGEDSVVDPNPPADWDAPWLPTLCPNCGRHVTPHVQILRRNRHAQYEGPDTILTDAT